MIVGSGAVDVWRWLHTCTAPERPEAEADKRRADQALAPRRDRVDRRQETAEQNGEHGDEHDAGCVADSPCPSGDPSAVTALDRQRTNGCQMVRPREYVKETGECAGKRRQHGIPIILEPFESHRRAGWPRRSTSRFRRCGARALRTPRAVQA